ncbi:MAG: hypothetical protein LBL81_02035 [Tannerella sp.]|jgi:hypothetical protein|nr:hypothetical protein [Tannerella sp.]
MEAITVEIINPKAQQLLNDLAELKLIRVGSLETEKQLADAVVTHLASENTLAKDWLNATEDLAWKDL